MNIRKMSVLAMLVALGVVLSPILRIPGMAPMQHFINIVTAVLLGPWYALACALMIAFLRMTLMGINLLAVTGAIFGAVMSGILYRSTKKIIFAWIGEVIGTGIIGAAVSYPVMAFIYGNKNVALFTYIPSFIAGTLIGGLCAFIFLRVLNKTKLLQKFQNMLDGDKI